MLEKGLVTPDAVPVARDLGPSLRLSPGEAAAAGTATLHHVCEIPTIEVTTDQQQMQQLRGGFETDEGDDEQA
jgi:hypothetical protein